MLMASLFIPISLPFADISWLGIVKSALYVLLLLGSIFLILLILIQRGRGGGLAGALGGMGGYSAFGTRAGDIFTRITIVVAILWILGAMLLTRLNLSEADQVYKSPASATGKARQREPLSGSGTAPAQSQETDSSAPASQEDPALPERFVPDLPPAASKQSPVQESD
jgi:preprotein translocase subunit SecG